jgi:O-antigen/teichoic acid export membrane protein
MRGIVTEVVSPSCNTPLVFSDSKANASVLHAILQRIPGLRERANSPALLKVVSGGVWTGVGLAASQVLRLAASIVLARKLLDPSAFGLVALVNVYLGGLSLLTDLGIATDVVQHPRGDEPEFINTAFWIQVVRGFFLCGIAAALAYPFASFYKQPQVLPLVLVASTTVLVTGFTSGSIWTLTRHVTLGRVTILRVLGDVVGLIVSIAWALASPTAWALIVGKLATALCFVVGSHIIADQRVTLTWNRSAARDIMMFGLGMFASSATFFLAGESERLVIGKFTTLVELGCFSLALSISAAASQGLQQLISQVFYPFIASSLRTSRDAALRHLRHARKALVLISGGLGLFFIIASHRIVLLLLGPRYVEAGWMLQWLGFRTAFEIFIAATASTLFSAGVSRYAATANVSKLIFMAGGLWIAFSHFGLHGAVIVLAVAPIAAYIPYMVGMRKYFREAFAEEVFGFALLLFVCTGAMVVTKFIYHY